jgi:hypothetical protein
MQVGREGESLTYGKEKNHGLEGKTYGEGYHDEENEVINNRNMLRDENGKK